MSQTIRKCVCITPFANKKGAYQPTHLHSLISVVDVSCHDSSLYNLFNLNLKLVTVAEHVTVSNIVYHKVPKFLDARTFCCNLLKIQTKRPNLRVFHQKDANGIAN